MAGGDGSQALVASIAAEHDVPYVCVPAGTRNHFAFDIGIDRADVVGALEAFFDGSERRIDLARVNGRVFVNNVSMGLYGKVVQSQEYRDTKLRTVIDALPELLGPGSGAVRPPVHRSGRFRIRRRAAPAGVKQPLRARPTGDAGQPRGIRPRHARGGGRRHRTTIPRVEGMDHADLSG